MNQSNRMFDAIIVGGGHNGLVAASYLAKAGKSVLLLEAQDELGGATTSVKTFPEYDAKLSRYSYLVSLLPDKIVHDLGLNFKTLDRAVVSYTPYHRSGLDEGLLIGSDWDEATCESFLRLTGSDHEGNQWREFYAQIRLLASRLAPTMLQPLKNESKLKSEIGLPGTWRDLIEIPIGEVILNRFAHDMVRGMVLTDGLIGTFVSAGDMQANRCFLYHLIGNGTGKWRVPLGGMGSLVFELQRVAKLLGVQIRLNSKVVALETGPSGVRVETESGDYHTASDLLFAGAPQHLARLRGGKVTRFLDGSQLKINMLLSRLPRLKSGIDPRLAFAGTFHVNESYSQLETAYKSSLNGEMPDPLPLEMYCHTLTDPTILSKDLNHRGFHTLTLFGLHTPAMLFDENPEKSRDLAMKRAITSLNEYLAEPIETVLALRKDGSPAIEVKSPLDLEKDILLPRGNIFHQDLEFPFLEDHDQRLGEQVWGAETDDPHIYLAGAGARRGGGVSGIAGHNAAMALLSKTMKIFLIMILILAGPVYAADKKTPIPNSHSTRNIEGWTIRIDDRLLKGNNVVLGDRALKLLTSRLVAITFVVRGDALEKLRTIPIQLDLNHGELKVMQYHPDVVWLKRNGYSENLAKCVHIPDLGDFLDPTGIHGQPWVVLHELAHGFHDQVIGFEDKRIINAWKRFCESGKYMSVLTVSGKREKHYGLTDHKELFAEITETYFGSNDFYPFVAGELKQAEPELFELFVEIWGPLPGITPKKSKGKP